MTPDLEIWCVTPSSSGGWGPITSMADLAGRLLDAPVRFIHPARDYGYVRRALSLAPGRRAGQRSLLLIAAAPGDLLTLADPRVLAGQFRTVGVWIIDSFWAQRLPRFVLSRRHGIDQIWITDQELLAFYRGASATRCDWLPWGTDALAAVQADHAARSVDVLRLGRQPALWDDDASNASALAVHGLRYQGRFDLTDDGSANQVEVRRQLDRAKVVLASGSLASPSDYSHPTRDYISARLHLCQIHRCDRVRHSHRRSQTALCGSRIDPRGSMDRPDADRSRLRRHHDRRGGRIPRRGEVRPPAPSRAHRPRLAPSVACRG